MTDSGEFLVEVGTEELPPQSLLNLSNAFRDGLVEMLGKHSLDFGAARSFATPRRLAIRIESLSRKQPDQSVERRGPPVRIAVDADGAPTKAGSKFAESVGVAFDDLERLQTNKGEYLVYRGMENGRSAEEVLPELVMASLGALPVARRMRWGSSDEEFVRPVRWLVMMMDENIVEAEILGQHSGRITRGHRFLCDQALSIEHAKDYPAILENEGNVIADFDTRLQLVRDIVTSLAAAAGGAAIFDDALLREVTSLVEWPVPVDGRFDERFLELPREVLVSTLQSHQRYFPIEEASSGAETGPLLPRFIAISNLESRDPEQVRLGNQRVIRPRLDDAAFFWDTDRKRSLASRRDDLKGVIFQKSLGSLLDKSARVDQLAKAIAAAIGADEKSASRAAQLGKCDLTTDMVGEFPDLQGIMGRYYALNDGEGEATAKAIEEQYLPRHAGDVLPVSPAGQALAIAEKIDTLAGIFGIGQKPTGTRDPFGLRRGALGVLRIAIEGGLDLDLRQVIDQAAAAIPGADDPDALAEEVFDYMMDRLRAYYTDGVGSVQAPVDVFESVLARRPSSPLDFHQRIEAVLEFVALPAADSLAAANKRVANILDKAEEAIDDAANPAHMIENEEKALFQAVTSLSEEVVPLLDVHEYRAALEKLATLRKPVDDFFDAVMVMDEDAALRHNRLALLKQMRNLFLHAADLSKLAV